MESQAQLVPRREVVVGACSLRHGNVGNTEQRLIPMVNT